jgi:hypothetical protein
LPPEQQPRHGPALHDPPGTQVALACAQIAPGAQSPTALQPQWPLTHAAPDAEPAQLAHIAPPVPQVVAFCDENATHAVPLQQPIGHELLLHAQAFCTHAWPLAHVTQATPPVPHALLMLPIWHMPFASQQPFLQVFELHEPQVWLAGSQLAPFGQSLVELQPHRPARQA